MNWQENSSDDYVRNCNENTSWKHQNEWEKLINGKWQCDFTIFQGRFYIGWSINGKTCVVTTDKGDDITSLKININSVGDSSTVSLRPERVEINSSEGNFENSFNAKVKELIYLGDHIRTRVEVCGNDQFIVKVPNSYKGANLKEGTSVKLSWKASDSRALDLG